MQEGMTKRQLQRWADPDFVGLCHSPLTGPCLRVSFGIWISGVFPSWESFPGGVAILQDGKR